MAYAHGMVAAGSPRELEVGRSRSRKLLLGLLLALVLAALAAWYATHPAPLPAPDRTVAASAPAGGSVYVGVYSSPATDGRTLDIRRTTVPTDVDLGDGVSVLVCRGGGFSVTADPSAFCGDLAMTDASSEQETLRPGDTLVVGISSDAAIEATLGPVSLAYREGLQWDTQDVGPRIAVTFLPR